MSIRRLAGTAASMGLIAVALSALTPGIGAMAAALADAQRTADRLGPDALVVAAAGLVAWVVWAWGALGLALTATSAVPGLLGAAPPRVLGVPLPAGARRAAALALGLGVGVAAPLLLPATAPGTPVASAAAPPSAPAVGPAWPTPPPPPRPSCPTGPRRPLPSEAGCPTSRTPRSRGPRCRTGPRRPRPAPMSC